jgi:hypothetical protein
MSTTKSIAVLLMMVAASACTPKENAGGSDASVVIGAASASSMASASGSAMASAMASAAASAAPVTAANDPLPSHSDVAKQVRTEITKANYKTELDKLEKEIE